MAWPARPTLRCLYEDLYTDWDNVGHQRALKANQIDDLPPLHQLGHQLVRHAAEVYRDGSREGEVAHESISGLRNPPFWKLKTGRWRGAIYVDSTGQPWLCAGGLRREGEQEDFYSRFMREIGSFGVDRFLPTEADQRRLRFEANCSLLERWERQLHLAAQSAFRSGLLGSEQRFDVTYPWDGSRALASVAVTAEKYAEASGTLTEVTVEVSVQDWGVPPCLERAELVVLAAIDPYEQHWTAGHGKTRIYSTCTEDTLEERLRPADLAGQTIRGDRAHYAHRERIVGALVEGEAIKALCGQYFVPQQDHDALPVCPVCELLFAQIRA